MRKLVGLCLNCSVLCNSKRVIPRRYTFDCRVKIDFSLTVKAVTLIFIPGRGPAIPSAKRGKSGSIYNLVKN